MMLLLLSRIALFCQAQTAGIEEKEVLRNEDVIFHQIDEHTWFGTGHLMANESLYLVEGETKAILIDAGTKIKDLDKLVASITDKPVTLVWTGCGLQYKRRSQNCRKQAVLKMGQPHPIQIPNPTSVPPPIRPSTSTISHFAIFKLQNVRKK